MQKETQHYDNPVVHLLDISFAMNVSSFIPDLDTLDTPHRYHSLYLLYIR